MTQLDLAQYFAQQVIATKTTYEPFDQIYLTNQIYALVGELHLEGVPETEDLLTIVSALVSAAIQNHKIEDNAAERDILEAQLTNFYTPRPAVVNQRFWNLYQQKPQAATDYFFQLSQANNYIKTKAIAQNISYETATEYGDLEMTINLSKPEKDPKAIAKAKNLKPTQYPKCALCLENEGYLGRANYPARTNHRVVRLTLGGQTWGLQYSPYAYFKEHCIFLSEKHTPMHIDRSTFANLFEIVRLFPHYFVGSNADLPIVGGSMLGHDHYQGGRHDFPMAKADLKETWKIPGFPEVQAGIVNWPMSVIRLTSDNITDLIDCSGHILDVWRNYQDVSVNVRAHTKNGAHHTITPIVRYRRGHYEIDLVLRDNQTSTAYPDGIFHPHPDVQHIKKENIGLIEVMGRAILPARLKTELKEVAKYLLDQPNHMKAYHQPWADQLKQAGGYTKANVIPFVDQAVGQVFKRVLEDAGVFKNDALGSAAFKRFIHAL